MNTPRHYALPNKNHDVIDDINDLRSTFATIDNDITNTEERIEENNFRFRKSLCSSVLYGRKF